MQLMPATAQELSVKDRTDPRQSIEGCTKYLAQQLERYKGDVRLALAAYNAGAGNVDKYHGVPPFKETQNYVKKITGGYNGAGPAACFTRGFEALRPGHLAVAGPLSFKGAAVEHARPRAGVTGYAAACETSSSSSLS
jgi:hypothetical protein